MKRWHWMSLAFLVLALVRTWLYAKGRRMWVLGLMFLFAGCLGAFATPSYNIDVTCPAGLTASPSFGISESSGPNWYSPSIISSSGSWISGHIVFNVERFDATNHFNCQWNCAIYGGANVIVYSGNSPDITSDGQTFTVSVCGGAPGPCYTNLSFSVKNSDSVGHFYYQAVHPGDSFIGGLVLDPGQSGQSLGQWPCTNASSVRLWMILNQHGSALNDVMLDVGNNGVGSNGDLSGNASDPTSDTGVTPSGSAPGTIPTANPPTTVTTPPIGQYNPTNSMQTGTNAPILWSPSSATNAAQATQQGIGALWDQNSKFGDQAHADAAAISAGVGGIYTNVAAVNLANAQWASNMLFSMNEGLAADSAWRSNVAANGLVVSNVTHSATNRATESTLAGVAGSLQGMSNLSSQVAGWLGDTNGYIHGATNGFGGAGAGGDWGGESTNYGLGYGGVTNAEDAMSVSGGDYGGLFGFEHWISEAVSGVTMPDEPVEGGLEGGGMGNMEIDFGHLLPKLDCDPTHGVWGAGIKSIMDSAQMLIKWLLAIWYINKCLVDARWAWSVCNQSHGTQNAAGINKR